jgi:hypothetical protein
MRSVSDFQRRGTANLPRGALRLRLRRSVALAALLMLLLSLALVTMPPRRDDAARIHLLILTLLLGG